MDSGEGWVPLTMGSNKLLFPNTNVNLLIRGGTKKKAQIGRAKYEGKARQLGADLTEGVGWLKVVPG